MKQFWYGLIRRIFNFVTYTLIGLQVVGEEHIPQKGPFIVVCNHASYFDPPLLGTAMRHHLIHFMAKEELFRNPIMNWFLRYMNTFPVRRGTIDRRAVIESFRVLKKGEVLGIFPEGTSKYQGTLGKFHDGFAGIAIKAGVPVLPAAVIHSRSLPKKTGPVKIIFSEPVMPPPDPNAGKEQVRSFSEQIRDIVLSMLNSHKGDRS
ncbi:1-acyl-sn-glycerol-3-phosphate acyltransferase [uncultured Megasphaera sp.]|uniref:lysophospholipid acyltransferase family protein n=1 Tax=uncultured Megasphaera sp. TaxID=165188 RepID=UPI002657D0ED|nr:lysophospholipid acyltransferase family protein [uncultured Megasphaera sp.]